MLPICVRFSIETLKSLYHMTIDGIRPTRAAYASTSAIQVPDHGMLTPSSRGAVGFGGSVEAGATAAVAADVADVEPAAFVAVTTTRIVSPASALASVRSRRSRRRCSGTRR